MMAKRFHLSDFTGRWDQAFQHLAGDRLDRAMENWGRHVLCPVHGGKDGNGFRLFDDGSGGSVCNTCGNFPNGIKTLAFVTGQDEKTVYKEVFKFFEGAFSSIDLADIPKYVPPVIDYSGRKIKNEKIWSATRPLGRKAGLEYLVLNRKLKGLQMPDSSSVRFHPELSYWCKEKKEVIGKYPAIVSAIKNANGEINALHRIYLDPVTFAKANVPEPKKVSGKHVENLSGGAIRLYDVSNSAVMGVAEGIETALAATILTGIPCWATYSAQMMEKVAIPENIKKLVVFADKDLSNRGTEAAKSLKDRMAKERPSLEVEIRFPTLPLKGKGVDFLDQLVEAV